MRVVFDTNVLLSGVFTSGICDSILTACFGSDEHQIVLSEHILNEIANQIGVHIGPVTDRIRQAVEAFRAHAELVEPSPVPPGSCRDPSDLPVLGTALAAKAECLVTGDKDLLVLKEFQGIAILSPREFLQKLLA